MKHLILLCWLLPTIVLTKVSYAQDISFGGLKFRSKTLSFPGGSIKRLEDSTFIGWDAPVFKSLLFTTATIEIDTTVGNQSFTIYGPFTLMAKVGTGDYLPVWQVTSGGTTTINANDLISGSGYEFTGTGSNISVSGAPFTVAKIYFEGQPSTPTLNNSYVSANGLLVLPETGNALTRSFTGSEKVSIYDTGSVISSFDVSVDTIFTLKQVAFETDGMHFQYDFGTRQYSLYGQVIMNVDDAAISCTLGDSTLPGISYVNGALDKVALVMQDSFQLHSIKLTPQQAAVYYSKTDDQYKMYGALDAELEQEKILIVLGDSTTPGCVVENGKIIQFSAGVQGAFILKGLTFNPDPLTLMYNVSDTLYAIYGDAHVAIKTDTIDITVGNVNNPGMVVENGLLQDLNLAITADFSIKGLDLHPKSAALNYSRSNDLFSIYGALDAGFSGNIIDVEVGDINAPGLVIDKSTLDISSMAMTTTDSFKLFNLVLEPDDFHFEYDKTASQYEMWGNMDALLGQDTISMQMGDSTTPGLLLSNGTVQQLELGITDDFKLFGLGLYPQGLTCAYSNNGQYGIFGQVNAVFDSDTIQAGLGTSTTPGLSIVNGVVTSVDFSLSASFDIAKTTFTPANATFHYDNANSYYELYGTLDVKADNDDIGLLMGDSVNPGLIIQNGSLLQLNAGINGSFTLKGLEFSPDSLDFIYSKPQDLFEIYGDADIVISTDSISLSLGTASNPGLLLKDGELQNINLGITADFKLKGLEFSPKQTTINYTKANNQFIMFGTLDAMFDGNVVDVDMGDTSNPGLKINTANGKLQQLNLTTTDTFKLYSLVLEPDSFHFEYDTQNENYVMWGGMNAIVSGDTINIQMGDASSPGLLLDAGIVKHLNFGITADFKLSGLNISTQGLTGTYQGGSNKEYAIYGAIEAKFESNTISAHLGNSSTPGLKIHNGQLESVDIGITGDFKIASLSFTPKDLTFEYDKANSYYEMYGSMEFSLEEVSITVDMGDTSTPGLIVQNGILNQLNFGINSAFTLAGLEVETNDVGVYYTRANSVHNYDYYLIKGEVSVKELWSISASLGDPDIATSGLELEIDGNGKSKIILDGFVIQAADAGVAGVGFNDIYAKYSKDGSGYKIDVSLDVSFPAGFEVDAGLAFEKSSSGKLVVDSIGIDFTASGGDPGIEIPETGIFIVELGGEVSKDLSGDYSFDGIIALALGGNFSFDGKNCEMLRITGEVAIDKNHLEITDKLYVAAYESSGDWRGALGQGEVELDLNWSKEDYSASGEIDILGEPNTYVKFLSKADYHSNGTFSALGEADIIIPEDIPIIGGKTLAKVDAAIRYNKKDLDNSDAAGWTTINLLIKKITAGIEYNFGNKSVKKIGESDVNNIKTGVANDAHNTQIYYYDFTVGSYVNAVTIHLKPKNTILYDQFLDDLVFNPFMPRAWDEMILQTPDRNNTNVNIASEVYTAAYDYLIKGDTSSSGSVVGPDMTLTLDSLNSNGISFHFQINTVDEGEALTTGRYSLYCNWGSLMEVFDVELQQHYASPDAPVVELGVADLNDIDIKTYSRIYTSKSPTISYYYNTSPDYNGAIFQTQSRSTNVDETIVSSINFLPPKDSITVLDTVTGKWERSPVSRNKDYYFYSVVNDGVSNPVYSNIEGPVSMGPAVNVSVTPTGTNFVGNNTFIFLKPEIVNENTISGDSKVTVYYDFDSMGYNGIPVPELKHVLVKDFKKMPSASFLVTNLNDPRYRKGIYFYSEIITPDGEHLRLPYSSEPLIFLPALTVNVLYNGSQQGAAGIKVWMDKDGNGHYNEGPDILYTTDDNGKVVFSHEWKSDITVGLILPSQVSAVNSTAILTKTISLANLDSTEVINFNLNYPTLTIEGEVLLDIFNLYSGSNYVFADLNMDGKRDNNEPMTRMSSSHSFSFNVGQPKFNLVYFDENLNGQKSVRLHDAKWFSSGEKYTVSTHDESKGKDKIYWIEIDQGQSPEDFDFDFDFSGNIY